MSPSPEAVPPPQLSTADIRSIFIGIMLAMLLSALDQTIVATALPTIGHELGDLEHLPWIVTAYLLAATAVTPLYGKFSDMHGRRVTLLIAIGIFLVGSAACALAPTMVLLALARAVQGFGGGGLISLAHTIVADMVSPRERGRYQMYFATVFASSSLAGPLLGGFFAQNLHWSLIFWINLPLGALALWLVSDRLKLLPRHERRHRLDVLGAVLMTAATVSFLLAMSWGGVRYPWLSWQIGATVLLSAALWVALGLRLTTAVEPLIPLGVLRDQVVRTAILAGSCGMGVFIGLSIFVPIFLQTVLGLSARDSGFATIPLMIGMVVGSTSSGRAMAHVTHYKRLPLVGVAVAALSLCAIAAGSTRLPFWALELLFGSMSVGLGTLMPVSVVAVQNAVQTEHLGTATATMNFARQLSGAIVVALFGAVVLGGGGEGVPVASLRAVGTESLAASFRILFTVAAVGLAMAWTAFLLMEERPFRERRPVRVGAVGAEDRTGERR